MTLHDYVDQGRARLEQAGIQPDEARLDAEVLARHALGWDRATWLARRREPAPPAFPSRYEAALRRREGREPIALITGWREFWGLDFEVTPAVLIPRPETELVIEAALAACARGPEPADIIDVGAGTGCLAIALAREFPSARVTAIDVSRQALDVARRNARRHGVQDRVRFVQADLLAGVRARADLIVSNPPYVPRRAAPALPPEVRDHEPHVALFGGDEGLDVLRQLADQAVTRLRPGGVLVAEFGIGQEPGVREAFGSDRGWTATDIRRDLQGIPRVIVTRRGPSLPGASHAN